MRLFFLPINLFVRFEAIDHYLLLTIDSNFLYHIHPVPLLILTPHPISWQCTHQLIMHLPQHHKVMFSSACHANCHHANKMQAHTQTTCVTSCTVSLGNFMHHDIKPDNFLLGRAGTKSANSEAKLPSSFDPWLIRLTSDSYGRLWHGQAIS